MADLFLIVTMFVVCGGVGLPVAYLLPKRYAWRALTSPVLGLAVLSVLAPVLYQLGVSVAVFFFLALAAAVMALAWHAPRAYRELRRVERRFVWIVAGGWLACTSLLLLPRLIGGDQLTVFQGNPWDTFAYLESSISYARESHASIVATTDSMLSQHPFLAIAKAQLSERPSVHLLYAAFTRVAPDLTYRLYYTFLIVWGSQFFLVAVFALRNVVASASPWSLIAIAGVFPLGFWGQYVLDINAWSQIASAPLLLLLFTLLVHAAAGDYSLRLAAVAAIVISGALYLYPEGLVIYAAALFPIVGMFALVRMIRARKVEWRALIPFGALLGIASGALYAPILRFLWKQITWSSSARVTWWEFFQIFFQGRDASWDTGFAQHADFTAGIFGLYFATPTSDAALATLQRGVIVVVASALVTAVVVMVVRGQSAVRAWAAATAVMLVPAGYLWHQANYWPAGKVLSYAAPVLLLLLCMTITRVRWLAGAFIAFHLATGVVRVIEARAPDGIHYEHPYPAIAYPPTNKTDIAWNMRGLEAHLKPSTKVLVQPTYRWLEQALVVFLYSRRIPYVKLGSANTYFGDGFEMPPPAVPWEPDVELLVDKWTFVLHFPSGKRPDIRVVARP